MPTKKASPKKAKGGFTDIEKASMEARIEEMKGAGEGEAAVLAKIKTMPTPDRALAERVHSLVMGVAPQLQPRLWYGMQAYALDGKTLIHFQDSQRFKSRYCTLGFSDKACLDEGAMWPVAFAVTKLTPTDETHLVNLVKKAVA